jgi:hypothetical protein
MLGDGQERNVPYSIPHGPTQKVHSEERDQHSTGLFRTRRPLARVAYHYSAQPSEYGIRRVVVVRAQNGGHDILWWGVVADGRLRSAGPCRPTGHSHD